MSYFPTTFASKTVLDVNFSAEPSQSLATNGLYTIAGQSFYKINSANDLVPMALVNGQGVVLQPNNACDYFNNRRDMPALIILPSSVDPNYHLRSGLRVWVYISADTVASNGYQNYENGLLFADAGNMNWSWSALRGANDGPKLAIRRIINATTISNNTPFIAIDDGSRIIILDVPRIDGFEAAQLFGPALSGGWPFLKNMFAGNTAVDDLTATSGRSDYYCPSAANVQVGFAVINWSGALPASMTVARLRIDVLD